MKQIITIYLSLAFLFTSFVTPIFSQQQVSIPIKKDQEGYVIDFKPPYDTLVVDLGENNLVTSETINIPISASTPIVNKKNKALDRSLIRPGMRIELNGERKGELINVSRIKVVTDIEKWEVDVNGYFESLEGDKAWVNGQAVKLTPGAIIKGQEAWKNKRFQSFQEMQLGSQLSLNGIRRSDGIVYVSEGEAKPNEFSKGDISLLRLVQASMLLPASLAGGRGKVAGREVKFANDPELQKYVTKVGYKLVPRYQKDLPDNYPGKMVYRFAVIEDDSFNAFALPDGSIFVHTGLLKQIKSEGQLAAILGHEIAHVTHEHSRKRMENPATTWGGLAMVLGGAVLGGQAGAQLGAVAANAFSNKYGRDAEDQADRVGLYYMAQAGYDPREAPKVWREISKNTRQDTVSNFLYSDHSTAKARLKNLNREIAYNYYDADLTSTKVGSDEYMRVVGGYFGWVPRAVAVLPNPSTSSTPRKPLKAGGAKQTDGFATFFSAFKRAVMSNNRAAIKSMMSASFEWALDGYGTNTEALSNMDQMRLWPGLRNAVLRKPIACKQSYCNNRIGYRTWSSAKYQVEIMFEKDGNGVWHWTALLGD